jgi:hypothetical protein
MMLRYSRFGVGRGGSRGRHVGRVVVGYSVLCPGSILYTFKDTIQVTLI